MYKAGASTIAWIETGALPMPVGSVLGRIDTVGVNDGVLYAAGWTNAGGWWSPRIWSYNPGTNAWTDCGDPAPGWNGCNSWEIQGTSQLVSLNNVLYVCLGYWNRGYDGSAGGVFSFSGGTTWVRCGSPGGSYGLGCRSFTTDGTALYTTVIQDGGAPEDRKVWRWTSGTSWADIGSSGGVDGQSYVFNHGTAIFSASKGSTRANDRIATWAGGTSWTDVGKPTHSNAGYNLGSASDGSQLYIGHVPDSAHLPEIFAYSAPSTWVAKGTLNLNGATSVKGMLFHGTDIFAGSTSDDVEKLTPPSTTWVSQSKPLAGSATLSGASLSGVLYFNTSGKVYHS